MEQPPVKEILILDHNHSKTSVIDDISSFKNWKLSVTYDPLATYNLAKNNRPDLIILDYLLLDKEAEDICEDFKNDALLSRIPLIIVTVYQRKQTAIESLCCDSFFVRPIDNESLTSRINSLLAS